MNRVFKGLIWMGHKITETKFSVLELICFPFLLLLIVGKPLIGVLTMLGFLFITTILSVVFEEAYKALNKEKH